MVRGEGEHDRSRGALTRRALSVPGVAIAASGLSWGSPLWVPTALAVDLVRAPRRLPTVRLLSFALAWSWLECIGVAASAALWATGQSDRRDAHYALQRWWAARLRDGLKVSCNLQLEVDGIEVLDRGPIVMCSRHDTIADALLPAWLLGERGMRPRYVMKRDLLIDPCLDIVGNRLPNHFVDREADDSSVELQALSELAHGMVACDAAVIYPEGTVATDARRAKSLGRLADIDPQRAHRLGRLRHLLPPRPGGTAALLDGAPDADVVFLAHVGFEGLERVVAAPALVPLAHPVRVRLTRVPRAEIPTGEGFTEWIDRAWLDMDEWVGDNVRRSESDVR